MLFKLAIPVFFLLVVSSGMSMNIQDEQQSGKNENKNILYFKAHDDKKASERIPSFVLPSNATKCGNSNDYCDSNLTCCLVPGSTPKYMCCPFSQGVCCPDGIHCCPPKSHCDMFKRQCYVEDGDGHRLLSFDWNVASQDARHMPIPQKVLSQDVVCPGGAYMCPDSTTCCQLPSGSLGCCPLPQAVCCSDHDHCCPSGYTCDVSAGTCVQGDQVKTWLTKVPAKPAGNVVLCDDGSQCPTGNTCCALTLGQYGCCPSEKAVCCTDHIHCCPRGYECDVFNGACTKDDSFINWLTKQPAKSAMDPTHNSVVCPGGQEQCPDGTTCCKMQSGDYGCCSYPKAVCCLDGLHCCPEGYTCDVSAGLCFRHDKIITELTKIQTTHDKTLKCQDSSECPSGSTCCQMGSGHYGCCPLEQAVCCSDHVHCCPSGYRCDVFSGTCARGDDVLTWMTKRPSKPA